MSSIGTVDVTVINGRVAALPVYFPEHTKNGITINARCEFSAYVNRAGRKDNTGNRREGRSDSYKFVAWGGLADVCAKAMAEGKEFSCHCDLRSYAARVRNNGEVILKTDGSPLMITKSSLTIKLGTLCLGADSAKTIQNEIAGGKRPVNWDKANHPDNLTWKSILQQINSTKYAGGGTFGNAKVIIPSGAGVTCAYNTGLAGQVAGAAGGEITVDGFTLAQYRASGWVDSQLMADPRLAVLIQGMAPVAPTPGMAAGAGKANIPF